jgi:hypothetical protein
MNAFNTCSGIMTAGTVVLSDEIFQPIKRIMKKKQLSLSKKLIFSKETISSLNSQQQSYIAGGKRPPTWQVFCITNEGSCNTFRPDQDQCILC